MAMRPRCTAPSIRAAPDTGARGVNAGQTMLTGAETRFSWEAGSLPRCGERASWVVAAVDSLHPACALPFRLSNRNDADVQEAPCRAGCFPCGGCALQPQERA